LTTHHVTALASHQGAIFAGTTEGILRSQDLGETWQSRNTGLAINHIRWMQAHPIGPVLLAGTEPAAIFISHDAGKTWRPCPEVADLRDENGWYLPYSPRAGCVRGFAYHGSRVYAAVEQGGVLRSDDRGETWQLVAGCTGDPKAPLDPGFIHVDVHSVAVHPASPDLVIAPTGGGLYRSTDGGATWKQLYSCYCRATWLDPKDTDHIIFGPADSVDSNGRIEETQNGGQSWQSRSTNLKTPWSDHMVERFETLDGDLLTVLSNGELLTASPGSPGWRAMLPEISQATAVIAGEV
jgi:photosystem II stability/assembly factor-like uncharacterized protein